MQDQSLPHHSLDDPIKSFKRDHVSITKELNFTIARIDMYNDNINSLVENPCPTNHPTSKYYLARLKYLRSKVEFLEVTRECLEKTLEECSQQIQLHSN